MTRFRATIEESEAREQDVVVDLPDEGTADDLISLVRSHGVQSAVLYCDNVPLVANSSMRQFPLSHGSIISTRLQPATTDSTAGLKVVTISGPDSGLSIPLPQGGAVIVGRSNADLKVGRDNLMSSRHARFSSDGMQVTVEDLESANGTFVEGEEIAPGTAQVIEPGTYIHMGSSVLMVMSVGQGELAKLGAQSGATWAFPRRFREALPDLPRSISWPTKDSDHDLTDSMSIMRAVLPLLSMGAFFLTRFSPWFYLLAAAGPAYIAVDMIRRKRRSEAKKRTVAEKYDREVVERRAELRTVRKEERRRARSLRPFGGIATVFAATRHERLWERRAGDAACLAVTVGLATLPSGITASSRSGESVADDDVPRNIWGLPVDVHLGITGSIGVVGSIERAQAVVRGMLLTLAVTHSPSDLNLWIFASDDSAGVWGFARWLPHLMTDDVASRVASTPETRADLWASLKQVIDSRSQAAQDGTEFAPVHVFVIDGSELLEETEVADMLGRGPAYGIIGIVTDAQRTPDGVMGTLTLGTAADEAVFESRHQARIDNVLTAEMSNATASRAARRLAGLSSSIRGPRTLETSSRRLVEMLGPAVRSPEALAASWDTNGPMTRVIVGGSADSEFRVDIVGNGPHGLVGGATRSGKTELLKTFIMSLAAANDPRELNFVIIDFKGGIDYALARNLPHVLEVTSNEDLDRFERTIAMLMAEQQRRQDLFKKVGVVNLDAFRAKRKEDPSIPPMPRLIVLVDEFGELSSSDVGRAQMKKLESITRIGAGLGINLVLITQNFQGQLPDQIAANTGMRICFRVQEVAHSKVLLGTGIAATLDPALIGRGFAQLKGRDPIEFQSARIAGRRPEFDTGLARGSIAVRPYAVLPLAIEQQQEVDPPDEQTDMYALLQTIAQAAAIDGWVVGETKVVPWPEPLPEDAPLIDSIPMARVPGSMPFGLVDLPDRQERGVHSLRFDDDHILMLGGAQADLQHAITMVGIGAALNHSPDEVHIYGIDFAGRSLARLAQLPHCAAIASRNDVLALRMLQELLEEVARRRSLLVTHGVPTLAELRNRVGISVPQLLVLVASAERMLPTANSSASTVHTPLTSLVTESSGLGIQVVMAGTPTIAQHRPGSNVGRRLVFRTVETGDAISLGVPRPLVGDLDSSRKFVDLAQGCSGLVCSLAAGETSESDALDALTYRLRERYPVEHLSNPPRRLREVAWPVQLDVFRRDLGLAPAHMALPLPVGLDAVIGEPQWVDAAEDGPTFGISGERRTGRSSALLTIGRLAADQGWTVIATAFSKASPVLKPRPWLTAVPPTQLDDAIGRADGRLLLLIDDLQRPAPDLEELVNVKKVTFVLAAGTASSLAETRGTMRTLGLKFPRNGVVLSPRGYPDFEAIQGIRRESIAPEVVATQRAGVGALGLDAELLPLIVPFDPTTVEG